MQEQGDCMEPSGGTANQDAEPDETSRLLRGNDPPNVEPMPPVPTERVSFIMGTEVLPSVTTTVSGTEATSSASALAVTAAAMTSDASTSQETVNCIAPAPPQSAMRKSPRSPPANLTIQMPSKESIDFSKIDVSSSTCGSTTAPVFHNDRVRFFSFSAARRNQQHPAVTHTSSVAGAGAADCAGVVSHMAPMQPRVAFLRQNTVGGGGDEAHAGGGGRPHAQLLTRAISRTYTMTSNASSSIGVEEWKAIFDKLDMESDGRADGHIPLIKFREILEDDPVWSEAVPKEIQENILGAADRNGDGLIDYDEFMDMVKGTHIGLSRRKRRAMRELLKQTVEFIVPYKYSYQNQYSCSPPPLFMLTISLLQVVIFAYNSAVMYKEINYIGLNGPVPYCSHLIYDPDKRQQVWRYLTYMFIHSGLFHATFNILIQLVLGIPLEMVHGWWRVMLVYVSGVLAGSLWTSVLRPNVFLSGASGGVYALITAHLGTVIMNFREMACPWCRILIVVVVAFTDTVVYIYDAYVAGHTNPVSYPAHISGAVTGLLVGISALKNLNWEPHERYIWAASTVTFAALMLVAIVWNLAVPAHFSGAAIAIPCISTDVI